LLLGIDLGTSGLKSLLVNEDGSEMAKSSMNYDISVHSPGVGEQNPKDWLNAAVYSIRKVVEKAGNNIDGISFSGQTHGIVCLDSNKQLLRPAIIWTDGRSEEIIPQINAVLGDGIFSSVTKNRPFSGYGVVSLVWLNKYEPEIIDRTRYILSPKDYLRFLMTDEIGMDYSDASGICCLDMEKKQLASGMLKKLGIDPDKFPSFMGESSGLAGKVSERFSEMTGLLKGTPVFFGGVDSCMQTLGNGVTQPGEIMINIGTSGQVATVLNHPLNDPHFRTTMFYHVLPDKWQMIGATLSAGLSLKWLGNNVLRQYSFHEMDEMAKTVIPGAEGCLFLPYLIGERTPHMNPNLKALFWGLTLRHEVSHMIRSVMEGVCFSLKECFDILLDLGVKPSRIVTAGGGVKSKIWMQILADVMGSEILANEKHEEACLGACITAGVGSGIFGDYQKGVEQLISPPNLTFVPNKDNHQHYLESFEMYKNIYKINAPLFNE